MNETRQTGMIPTVLTIAGSDPSGGAGIQADLKTFARLGVYGAAVITALTAQNTVTVAASMPAPADFVRQQLEAVLSDIRVDVIKLGMLPNAEICRVILPYLKNYRVVCDPVMVATSGSRLIDDAAVSALMDQVIPHADYITPNFHELEILHGHKINDVKSAGRGLMHRFSNLDGIILKGGHVDEELDAVTDILIYKDKADGRIHEQAQQHPRYHTRNTHGTGCTLSSAFAAFLAKKYDAPDAFSETISYIDRLIALSADASIGHGNGPLLHHVL